MSGAGRMNELHLSMMNSTTEWPTETIQYRLNLPHALHSISPALSALHASRAAALHPEILAVLHPSHCPKCGTYRFSGDLPAYLVGPSMGKKRRRAAFSRPKTLQRRCHVCGLSIDAGTSAPLSRPSVPIQLPRNSSKFEAVPPFPQNKEISQESPPADGHRLIPETGRTTPPMSIPPLPGRQAQPKSSRPKTSTLRDMLSRDRQREDVAKAHKKRKESHDGLAAFLKQL